MATTDFGAISTMQKKVWQARSWKATRDESFFFATGMVSSGNSDSRLPVQYVNELTKTSRGDQAVYHLIPDVGGDGVVDDAVLEGNEQSMTVSAKTIKISQLRQAIRNKGKMSEQKTVVRFRETARDQLGNWFSQKMDELAFLTVSGVAYTKYLNGATRPLTSQLNSLAFASDVTAPSTNRIMAAGTATSSSTITAADMMDWDTIVKACATAERKRIKPVRYNGKSKYVIVMSTECGRDLKSSNDYMTNVGRAADRGSANPLFKGMFAEVDNAILFSHPKVYNTLGASSGSRFGSGGTVHGAENLLLGAQALAFAKIEDMAWEEEPKDYKNSDGIAVGGQFGFQKPVFTSIYDSDASEDFGAIAIYAAAAA